MNAAIVALFTLAIALGASLAWLGTKRGRLGRMIPAVHGGGAIAAISLLGYRVFTGPENLWFNSAFFLFLLTAIGGVFMLAVHRRDEPPFLGLVALHALTGIVAFLVLVGGM
ncbi:hypothetical protein M0534_10940 [Methylonatrum kenyense]|uniref:hypothetical protein n=1 Tax=Methylonatrum kenyense TaxID=455253 RepID=UPI0020BD80A2|nr:hypothetical protein [Methylonatrum kenyense]MCK8516833.1 hypothetical protein [Methylonatrum kenyense]